MVDHRVQLLQMLGDAALLVVQHRQVTHGGFPGWVHLLRGKQLAVEDIETAVVGLMVFGAIVGD